MPQYGSGFRYSLRVPSHLTMYSWQSVHLSQNFLQCMIRRLPKPNSACKYRLRNVSKPNNSCHNRIGYDVPCIARSEVLRGPSDTLAHCLILVAPSCFRSHSARYIMLKSLNNRQQECFNRASSRLADQYNSYQAITRLIRETMPINGDVVMV